MSTTLVDPYELVDQSKHPASAAAGPYGHPFHPMAVTLPIGAWTASLLFDLLTHLRGGDQALATGSAWLIGIGILGALGAAVLGVMDLSRLDNGTRAQRMALAHLALNTAALTLFAVGLVWRQGQGWHQPTVPWSQFLLSAVAFGVLGASGWIGGKLAYSYGVRVAHEVDQADAFVR